MGFWTFGNIRTLLDTETDHDSPGSEELMSQIRENIEALFMLLLDTGVSGTATANPSNDANGYFYDTAGGWTNDLHNGRTLLITSGLAKGNMYTIDDTVDASDRLDCTGDNLYADGVRSGDAYKILFDLKVNTDGHDHDGVNSKIPLLGDASIINAKLKTSTGSASGTLTALTGVNITAQDYSFGPNIYSAALVKGSGVSAADYVMRFSLYNDGGGEVGYTVYYRYITASDEPFVYMIRDKTTGDIVHLWMAEDPPAGFWGQHKTPNNFTPPIAMINDRNEQELDKNKFEELICWRVEKKLFREIQEELTKNPGAARSAIKDKYIFQNGKVTKK